MTINPRLIELAKRLGNKDLPNQVPVVNNPVAVQPISIPSSIEDSFILSYDDYGRELIAKSNELFRGTKAEIPLDKKSSGEVPNMYILKRLALITAIYKTPSLKSMNLWPITPLQSEQLLKDGKLPKPSEYWEDLGLLLYDFNPNGKNPMEAVTLHKNILERRADLGLSMSDLEKRLLVINAGLEKDTSFPYGVKPVVLPGLTKAYIHETLKKTGSDYKFEYGLDNGLPSLNQLGKGSRTIYMPSENENIGLRVLYRSRGLDLGARDVNLVYSSAGGRVNVARAKK